jgi:hypothetical protein
VRSLSSEYAWRSIEQKEGELTKKMPLHMLEGIGKGAEVLFDVVNYLLQTA